MERGDLPRRVARRTRNRLRTVVPARRSEVETLRAELGAARERAEVAERQRDRARTRVGRLEERTRQMRARIKRLEGSDDLGYVFIVTYGRSGSTLLQGILNSTPGVLIRGENRQSLRHVWQYDAAVHKIRRNQRRERRRKGIEDGNDTTHPFFGMDQLPSRRTRLAERKLALDSLLRPEQDTRVTGFKEIRWDEPDTPGYVAWLQEVFPGARFVVNTRDLDAVSVSKWWGKDPESRALLEQTEADLLALAADLGDAAYRVHYDDWVADPGVLEGLFAWLGEEWDPERVRATMERPHSY
ncbi:sulfotransferase [uncultured Nocardioides sp.]|uniref:sulfotransferase n=1 Tax=uncultured Nocardioides sp. TaxID=198441 RepID=UPI00260BC473|nr:sulfotransferase [uncultured Nocardioides sp.]